jgi:hypothetical protein
MKNFLAEDRKMMKHVNRNYGKPHKAGQSAGLSRVHCGRHNANAHQEGRETKTR